VCGVHRAPIFRRFYEPGGLGFNRLVGISPGLRELRTCGWKNLADSGKISLPVQGNAGILWGFLLCVCVGSENRCVLSAPGGIGSGRDAGQ